MNHSYIVTSLQQ